MKKGSTAFLHDSGYSDCQIAEALGLNEKDVENNLKGTGFPLDYKRIAPFEDNLPSNIGDIVTVSVPSWDGTGQELSFRAKVVQCIPQGGGCGLSVVLLENTDFEIPLYGKGKKDEEIVVPLDWIVK